MLKSTQETGSEQIQANIQTLLQFLYHLENGDTKGKYAF